MSYAHRPKSRGAICRRQKRKPLLWRNALPRQKCCDEFSGWKNCEIISAETFRKRSRLRLPFSKCLVPEDQMRNPRKEVSVRSGQVEFVKVGTDAWRWRDVYRWLLGLSWPQFAAFVGSLYV